MAKYTVNYNCGHTDTIELFGAEAQRHSRIAYLEEKGLCSECYKAKTAAAAKETANALSLPALEGSEKQIAWAEKIRAAKIQDFKNAADRARRDIETATSATEEQLTSAIAKVGEEKFKQMREDFFKKQNSVIQAYESALAQTSASWWIEHR